jgi:hypothetical protein
MYKLHALGLEATTTDGELCYERKQISIPDVQVQGMSDADFSNMLEDVKAFIVANPTEYPMQATTQELTIIDRAKETLLSGGAILQRNQQKAARYVSAAKTLIGNIVANGGKLNAELDIKANEAVVKLSATIKEVAEDTNPIRQAMVMIRDELKSCEKVMQSELDTIQKYRNEWAAECKREADRLAEVERLAAIKRQEIISVKADIEKSLLSYFRDYLTAKKLGVNSWFNAITLETFDKCSNAIATSEPKYDIVHYKTFLYGYKGGILSPEDVAQLIAEIKTDDKYNELCSAYYDEMLALRAEKVDLLQSKKSELERIAEFEREQAEEQRRLAEIEKEKKTANEARQKELQQLQAEAEQRQKDARQKQLEEEQAQQQREAEEKATQEEEDRKALEVHNSKVDIVAAQESTISLFEQTANTTPVFTGTKMKTVKKATITAPVGIYPIFQLWFENVGAKMTVEDLQSKLDFMFTYASKEANKNVSPLLIENEFVAYVEDTKAVTTKETAKDKKKKEDATV